MESDIWSIHIIITYTDSQYLCSFRQGSFVSPIWRCCQGSKWGFSIHLQNIFLILLRNCMNPLSWCLTCFIKSGQNPNTPFPKYLNAAQEYCNISSHSFTPSLQKLKQNHTHQNAPAPQIRSPHPSMLRLTPVASQSRRAKKNKNGETLIAPFNCTSFCSWHGAEICSLNINQPSRKQRATRSPQQHLMPPASPWKFSKQNSSQRINIYHWFSTLSPMFGRHQHAFILHIYASVFCPHISPLLLLPLCQSTLGGRLG